MVVDEVSEARRWRAVAIALGLLVLVAFLSVPGGVSQVRTERPDAARLPAACSQAAGRAGDSAAPVVAVGAVSL